MRRDLVLRAMAGDHDAFTGIVDNQLPHLYRVARLILRDDARAEDATQDALIAAWREMHSLRDPDRFDAWLHRTLVRACYREAGRNRVWRLEANVQPISSVAPDGTTQIADRDELERAFRRLSAEQRAVIVLCLYADLTQASVAVALGIPEGTVKSRLNRATRAMRASLAADARSTEARAGGVQ